MRVLVAALFTGASYALHAQSVPPVMGSDLARSCSALVAYAEKGGPITVDATSCAAYLKGLRDAVDAYPQGRGGAERPFCAGTAPLDDLARVVLKHLLERPDGARRHASGEALEALSRGYPCARPR